MTDRHIRVVIRVDAAQALAELAQARAVDFHHGSIAWSIANAYRHHRPEQRARSAMHAAYDRRRRARRRSRR